MVETVLVLKERCGDCIEEGVVVVLFRSKLALVASVLVLVHDYKSHGGTVYLT